ncbi:MAG TPA: N-methyl-D-aspartate receptor NMDAR2C subunit [Oxalicibacterium sp.]|jgi:predicted metal-dependent HD superfamily phosphohydrolase|nr:N-methyl-D-aspartate receptor NMDAR2C subunit [Oxalicibacterium sp.]
MFRHSPENQSWLRAKWQALVNSVHANPDTSDAVWDELIRHYSEPHRAYHNLSHIMFLLRQVDTHRPLINRPETVEFAIWFHDVIYDTHLKDNERRSTEWARRAMVAMMIDERHIPPVMACVAATEKHEIGENKVADLPLFLDMDLAILGAREPVYREYSEVIRAEYSWVPIEEYRLKRGQFLQRLLDRPALYFTPAMATSLEYQARQNLQSELRELVLLHPT